MENKIREDLDPTALPSQRIKGPLRGHKRRKFGKVEWGGDVSHEFPTAMVGQTPRSNPFSKQPTRPIECMTSRGR